MLSLWAGYTFVHLSEGWPATTRLPNGSLTWDPIRFPSGLYNLSAYLAERNLSFGIYLDVGHTTCAGFPGSYGHEAQDVATIASWGARYVWLDGCNIDPAEYNASYTLFSSLFNASGIYWEASWPAYDPSVDLDYIASIAHEWR